MTQYCSATFLVIGGGWGKTTRHFWVFLLIVRQTDRPNNDHDTVWCQCHISINVTIINKCNECHYNHQYYSFNYKYFFFFVLLLLCVRIIVVFSIMMSVSCQWYVISYYETLLHYEFHYYYLLHTHVLSWRCGIKKSSIPAYLYGLTYFAASPLLEAFFFLLAL